MSQLLDNKKIEIYGPSFSTFVRSIMLLCEEYGVQYTHGFEFDGVKVDYKSEEHLVLHPFAKFPVIKHGDVILSETASICRYLQAIFDEKEVDNLPVATRAHMDAFCAILSISVDKALIRDYLLEFSFPKGEGESIRFDRVKKCQPQAHTALKVIENELVNGCALGRDKLSIADVLVAPMLHYLSTLPPTFELVSEYPKLVDYFSTLMHKPSFQQILVTKAK